MWKAVVHIIRKQGSPKGHCVIRNLFAEEFRASVNVSSFVKDFSTSSVTNLFAEKKRCHLCGCGVRNQYTDLNGAEMICIISINSSDTHKISLFHFKLHPWVYLFTDVFTLTRVSMRCSIRFISSSSSAVNFSSSGSSSPRWINNPRVCAVRC